MFTNNVGYDYNHCRTLAAVGVKDQGDYCYRDGKEIKKVQDWINAHDGKYLTLFVAVPKLDQEDIESENSLVIVPREELPRDEDDIFREIIMYEPTQKRYVTSKTVEQDIIELENHNSAEKNRKK